MSRGMLSSLKLLKPIPMRPAIKKGPKLENTQKIAKKREKNAKKGGKSAKKAREKRKKARFAFRAAGI